MKVTLIVGSVILLGLAFGIGYTEYHQRAQSLAKPTRPVPNVIVQPVVRQEVSRLVEALGTVKSRESVQITAKVTEKVDRVHFEDGQQVNAGALLVTLTSGEQQAKVRAAQANLREQQREYRRIEGLVRKNTVARSELDKLRTGIEVARAILAQNQAELEARTIVAPFAGLLGFRQISLGALVTPGMVVTTLDALDTVKLDFSVPERFLGQIQSGARVNGRVAAFPDQVFSGQVTGLNSRVDPQTRAVEVRARVDNPQLLLRPGMLMTLALTLEARSGLVVPEEAIIPRQTEHFLMVVNGENVVEQRPVQLGFRSRGEVEILSGVQEGEQVITRGMDKVRPGQTVTTQPTEHFTYREAG
ncbi:efflux RND transporter periplasmic adaptor subunit [Photobacterium sp. 1_MG-2023]|uniref:efflux RND transporter periplasmic adaptor subunit n=1 Tax=Photobacterium sp. 1_MG-2023 TaxID=3062646 RepID=UPI0026E3A86C|nr:efflux RND transporter periplasmic adaptor subunit [Photobacterium sp. 1_MG-2023]MDO6708210.1 efflux RND transporter periplasmic adaptor subunit [Photobacterium sp. 1_MG-2023]